MSNVTILDNQKVLINSKPWTSSVPGRSAQAFGFQVSVANNSDPTNILELTTTAGAPASNPTFTARSRGSFFGPDRVVTVKIQGHDSVAGAPVKETLMTVTVQGTQPDDGTLDHFEPEAETPSNQ